MIHIPRFAKYDSGCINMCQFTKAWEHFLLFPLENGLRLLRWTFAELTARVLFFLEGSREPCRLVQGLGVMSTGTWLPTVRCKFCSDLDKHVVAQVTSPPQPPPQPPHRRLGSKGDHSSGLPSAHARVSLTLAVGHG